MKNRFIISLFTLICAVSVLAVGCGKQMANVKDTYSHIDGQEIEVIPLPDDLANPSENTIPITLSFVNMCGVDVGMFSIIDPATKEQVNLTPIADQESISIEANWPKDNMDFQWALYNGDGELCIEATSDLTGITESALIVISGSGDVESVDVSVN